MQPFAGPCDRSNEYLLGYLPKFCIHVNKDVKTNFESPFLVVI